MKNKALKISLIVLVMLLLSVVMLLTAVRLGERLIFAPFFANAETQFKVPGIADGFIQQGFDHIGADTETTEDDRFLVSGYMKDESSSRVYVLDKDGDVLHYVKLRDKNGKRYTGHSGGITHNGNYVYVSNDDDGQNSLNVFSLNEILSGKSITTNMLGSVYVYVSPAFCYIHDGKLYTGNFHKPGHKDYKSPESFIISTENNNNTAMMLAFELTEIGENFGVAKEPTCAYSITSMVQGMCVADGKLVLSTSWSINPSHLYFYDIEKIEKTSIPTSIFTDKELYKDKAMDKPIPLYIIDKDEHLIKDVTAPPMAEELVYNDGKVLVMNESASSKYIFGKFTSGNNVYGYIVD